VGLKLITPPSDEPVTLTEAKLFVRQDISADDALITSLISAARHEAETESQHVLITQTWDYTLEEFPPQRYIEIPHPPLQSVLGVYYTNDDGTEHTLSADKYIVDTVSTPGRVILKESEIWPTDVRDLDAVRIQFKAGFGDGAANVPADIRDAILTLIAFRYDNRDKSGAIRSLRKYRWMLFDVV